MGTLIPGERRQVFLAKEQARQAMLARMSTGPAADVYRTRASRRLHWLLNGAMILTLVAGSLAAYQFVELHPSTSLVEAFMPRATAHQ